MKPFHGLTSKEHFEVALECGYTAVVDTGRCGLHLVCGTLSLVGDGLELAAEGTKKVVVQLKKTEKRLESPELKAQTITSINSTKDKIGNFISNLNPWRKHAQTATA